MPGRCRPETKQAPEERRTKEEQHSRCRGYHVAGRDVYECHTSKTVLAHTQQAVADKPLKRTSTTTILLIKLAASG